MATATIVTGWKDTVAGRAYLAVRVAGDTTLGGGPADVEYIGSTPLLDAQGQAKSNATLKSECVADAKAQRDRQKAGVVDLGLTGTVTV